MQKRTPRAIARLCTPRGWLSRKSRSRAAVRRVPYRSSRKRSQMKCSHRSTASTSMRISAAHTQELDAPDRAAALYEQCLAGVSEAGGDPSLESAMPPPQLCANGHGRDRKGGEVVRHALSRVGDPSNGWPAYPIQRKSIARLSATQGRAGSPLGDIAQGDCAPAGDRRHLPSRACARPRGRDHAGAQRPGRRRAASRAGGAALRRRAHAGRHDGNYARSIRLRELLQGNATAAIAFAREALALCSESQKMERGISAHALADALALAGGSERSERGL